MSADLTPTDLLDLGDGRALAVVTHDGGASAVPVLAEDGRWRRATAGDGVAEALIRLLTAGPGRSVHGRFSVTSWAGRRAASGERAITVDQTNESVIVGEVAVVKWATHLEPGPHPAPQRLSSLTAAGFTAMPTPWGLVTWQPDDGAETGAETLVATVTGFLPGAVDGWTWAVDLFAAATRAGDPSAVGASFATVGTAVADLHAAQAATAATATAQDARRWRDGAMDTLKTAKALAANSTGQLLADHDTEVVRLLESLGGLVGLPILDAHGDLHVGQVLRSEDRFVITDFDGNPVLPPWQRVLPVPAALDVAGMLQSLSHVAIVVARHHDVDPDGLRRVDAAAQAAFLDAYTTALAASGQRQLFSAEAVPAFRLQQILREIVYAGRHLPRWMYVPDAALPALLEGVQP
ncbi:aminoglycoside phosphotransferase [Mycolicibacterium canariasense]|uniref:Glucosamine kinase n=1 Tax=Mycolicibacterium canariasense TaxID=228230 RepID=A0A100W9H7_MYCCR|nr:glucosamine kinase [Mycolicibacterium canariasense]MCV7210250.1 aminoglycoside phosphotransferase [Mycolicibacterium canariasense]ORV04449.1 aminoglycoside phosphotransferase [Mycolicibacterium canariasense]GAS94041.1 aminoglycoside phosphotransferase [Mycolicibacterium canariasense]